MVLQHEWLRFRLFRVTAFLVHFLWAAHVPVLVASLVFIASPVSVFSPVLVVFLVLVTLPVPVASPVLVASPVFVAFPGQALKCHGLRKAVGRK